MKAKERQITEWESDRAKYLVSKVCAGLPKQLGDELSRAFNALLPALQAGRHVNPVHHTAHVLVLMVDILNHELNAGRICPEQFRLGRLVALFHDAGNAFEPTGEKKLRVDDVREDPEKLGPALAQRRRHMDNGRVLAECMLSAAGVGAEDARAVARVVEVHDGPTTAELLMGCRQEASKVWACAAKLDNQAVYESLASSEWEEHEHLVTLPDLEPDDRRALLSALSEDGSPIPEARLSLFDWEPPKAADCPKDENQTVSCLLAILREADRLWMLTVEGVACDVGRDKDKAKAERKSFEERLKSNAKRHEDERKLYEICFGRDFASALGMSERTAFYRTDRGKQLYEELQPSTAQFHEQHGHLTKQLADDPSKIDPDECRDIPVLPKG